MVSSCSSIDNVICDRPDTIDVLEELVGGLVVHLRCRRYAKGSQRYLNLLNGDEGEQVAVRLIQLQLLEALHCAKLREVLDTCELCHNLFSGGSHVVLPLNHPVEVSGCIKSLIWPIFFLAITAKLTQSVGLLTERDHAEVFHPIQLNFDLVMQCKWQHQGRRQCCACPETCPSQWRHFGIGSGNHALV